MYRLYIKRFLDFWISLIALIIVSPILLVVTIWLYFANKGAGALFFQERPGKDGKIFKVIKFKTMTDERDAEGNLLSDAQRLTKAGYFVRSTSLDELPQLINVLKGDMSLIGPRPWVPEYFENFTEEQKRRVEVRPGIIGLAQVNGRNKIGIFKKLKYDNEYVDKCSLLLDIKIILKSFRVVRVKENLNNITGYETGEIQVLRDQKKN